MTSRRDFIKYTGSISIPIGLSGCIGPFDDSPSISISEPSDGDTVDQSFNVNVSVSNFDLRGAGEPSFEEPGGRPVLILGQNKEEGDDILEKDNVFDVFGGEQNGNIELLIPGEQDITAQLIDDDGVFYSYYDTIEVDAEFEVQDTVKIGPDGRLTVDPSIINIPVDTEVTFEWGSNAYSIVVTGKPESSDWNGVPELQREGYTHRHTFEVPGRYNYECEPYTGTMGGVINVIDN